MNKLDSDGVEFDNVVQYKDYMDHAYTLNVVHLYVIVLIFITALTLSLFIAAFYNGCMSKGPMASDGKLSSSLNDNVVKPLSGANEKTNLLSGQLV